ncbi:MAG: (deoxy)nucleoside triphosphate pyrophosphohydrolase [bacterium]
MLRVTAAVIERDGRVLIARRREGRFAGKWEFPGGKVEPGETPEACLERELREELEIEAETGRFICSSRFDYGDFAIELLAYEVSWLQGEMRPREHEELRWVPPQELGAYDFPGADLPIVLRLQERSKRGGRAR